MSRPLLVFAGTVAMVCCSLLPAGAAAHLLNMTRVAVTLAADTPGELSVEIDLGQSLLTAESYWALANSADQGEDNVVLSSVLAQLSDGLIVTVDGELLPREFLEASFAARSLAAIRNPLSPQMATLRWRLPPSRGQQLVVEIAPDLDLPWPCLVRSDSDGRELPVSRLLTADRRASGALSLSGDTDLSGGDGPWQTTALVYGWLGLQHILPLGLDHVLFVLGLFLAGGTVRQLVLLVSCFTVAHTLTLLASTLGVVNLPPRLVEPLIAASIVYIGLETLVLRAAIPQSPTRLRLRYCIVFAFGLLHGLGFASVLSEIGLPEGRFLLSLLAFNVGVETGQLVVLGTAALALARFRHRSWYASCIEMPGATFIAGIGLYWLLNRIELIG